MLTRVLVSAVTGPVHRSANETFIAGEQLPDKWDA